MKFPLLDSTSKLEISNNVPLRENFKGVFLNFKNISEETPLAKA
jgi:hypothetical protein